MKKESSLIVDASIVIGIVTLYGYLFTYFQAVGKYTFYDLSIKLYRLEIFELLRNVAFYFLPFCIFAVLILYIWNSINGQSGILAYTNRILVFILETMLFTLPFFKMIIYFSSLLFFSSITVVICFVKFINTLGSDLIREKSSCRIWKIKSAGLVFILGVYIIVSGYMLGYGTAVSRKDYEAISGSNGDQYQIIIDIRDDMYLVKNYSRLSYHFLGGYVAVPIAGTSLENVTITTVQQNKWWDFNITGVVYCPTPPPTPVLFTPTFTPLQTPTQ